MWGIEPETLTFWSKFHNCKTRAQTINAIFKIAGRNASLNHIQYINGLTVICVSHRPSWCDTRITVSSHIQYIHGLTVIRLTYYWGYAYVCLSIHGLTVICMPNGLLLATRITTWTGTLITVSPCNQKGPHRLHGLTVIRVSHGLAVIHGHLVM